MPLFGLLFPAIAKSLHGGFNYHKQLGHRNSFSSNLVVRTMSSHYDDPLHNLIMNNGGSAGRIEDVRRKLKDPTIDVNWIDEDDSGYAALHGVPVRKVIMHLPCYCLIMVLILTFNRLTTNPPSHGGM